MMSEVSRGTSTARDRGADVGRVERWRVVDAVAEEADDMAMRLEGADDPMLLRRRDPMNSHASSSAVSAQTLRATG
jgi:hypothetical protein